MRTAPVALQSAMLSLVPAAHAPRHKAGGTGHTAAHMRLPRTFPKPGSLWSPASEVRTARCAYSLLCVVNNLVSQCAPTAHRQEAQTRARARAFGLNKPHHCSLLSTVWCSARRCVAHLSIARYLFMSSARSSSSSSWSTCRAWG